MGSRGGDGGSQPLEQAAARISGEFLEVNHGTDDWQNKHSEATRKRAFPTSIFRQLVPEAHLEGQILQAERAGTG